MRAVVNWVYSWPVAAMVPPLLAARKVFACFRVLRDGNVRGGILDSACQARWPRRDREHSPPSSRSCAKSARLRLRRVARLDLDEADVRTSRLPCLQDRVALRLFCHSSESPRCRVLRDLSCCIWMSRRCWHRGTLRGLTFELTGRQRQDAKPGLAKMYRVPPDRAWWPAVGAPVERGVRPRRAELRALYAHWPAGGCHSSSLFPSESRTQPNLPYSDSSIFSSTCTPSARRAASTACKSSTR